MNPALLPIARRLPLLLLLAGTLALGAAAWWPRQGAAVALLFPPGLDADEALLRILAAGEAWHPVAVARRGPLAMAVVMPASPGDGQTGTDQTGTDQTGIDALRRATGAWAALHAGPGAAGCLGMAGLAAPLPATSLPFRRA